MSSTTSLVRSTSAPTALLPPSASPKATTPKATSTTVLPKLTLSPQTRPTPPKTPTPQPSTPSSSTPGQWRHPRMNEVIQRQNKTNFDRTNATAIGINLALLLISFLAPATLYFILPSSKPSSLNPYTTRVLFVIRAYFLLNIALAVRPLLRTPDTCEDVPLTPAQRQLLGLPPMSRPATPLEKEAWVTPPRYTRSRSGTPGSAREGSPLQQLQGGSPGLAQSPFGSQQQRRASGGSPSSLTPLRHETERRRLSYSTRNSPLSAHESEDSSSAFTGLMSTPTRKGNRASMGLNSKWLYEKGKSSPRGAGTPWDPKGWGTGSVFN